MFPTHVKQVDAVLIVAEELAVVLHTSHSSQGGYGVDFLITNQRKSLGQVHMSVESCDISQADHKQYSSNILEGYNAK